MYPEYPDVLSIKFIRLSQDRKYVAASVLLSSSDSCTANAIIYATNRDSVHHKRPKLVTYKADDSVANLTFTLLRFSNDSAFIAGAFNDPSLGVLIYEWKTDSFINNIKTCCPLVTDISFNPDDSSRICTAGFQNLFRYQHNTDTILILIDVRTVGHKRSGYGTTHDGLFMLRRLRPLKSRV